MTMMGDVVVTGRFPPSRAHIAAELDQRRLVAIIAAAVDKGSPLSDITNDDIWTHADWTVEQVQDPMTKTWRITATPPKEGTTP